MKKTDVYVVVDTPKKAKKLKNVLDMFGETESFPVESINSALKAKELIHYWSGNFVWADLNIIEEDNKIEVSIKELRNILAKEHLKAGDVVFMRSFRDEYESILKIKGVEGEYLKVDKQLFVKGSDSTYTYGQELIKDFIRYATEEEKALLEPKKELEVGKWYLFDGHSCKNKPLMLVSSIYNDRVYFCGFNFLNQWVDEDFYTNDDLNKYGYREATPQEVEKSLIKEAKRRDHAYTEYDYNPIENELCGISKGRLESVFFDGRWEKPASNYTDSDVSIVERLHDTLLDNHGYSLESKLLTDARMLANKIKSNIK